jgi:hypothetical protein
MFKQLNPFSIQIPKGIVGSFADTLVNHHQIFKSVAPEARDILFRKFNKAELPPFITDVLEDKDYLTGKSRSPISLSVNFNTPINNYLTPPASPSSICKEINQKPKRTKSIGINTEIPLKNEVEQISIKLPDIYKLLIFLFLLSSLIGIIIILIRKNTHTKEDCRETLFKK